MNLLEQIEKDFSQAFKERNELVVLVLRQIKTVLTNAEIAKKRQKLTAEETIKILRTEVKKRKEAADLYRQGGRPEKADKEEKEIEIIDHYLPSQLDDEKIKQKILEVIERLKATSPQEIGKVMGLVMKELAGQADGTKVNQLVKEILTEKSK